MLGMALHLAHRHLMRAPVAFLPLAVDLLRAGPALRRAHDDHRPGGTLGEAFGPRVVLDAADVVDHLLQRRGHQLVHGLRVIALDEMRGVAVAAHESFELLVRDAREHGRVGDLVAVEMQDRQHRAVARRIEKLVRVPARRERPRLRLAVADHAGDDEIRVVEGRAVGVRQRIAEFAALVDRTRRLRRDVARNAAGERELGEEPLHPLLVLRDVGIDLAVGPLEIGVGDQRRPAVSGAGDVDHVEVELLDQPVEVDVDEVQARRRAPVAEQARLDVVLRQRDFQQRVVEQIDLPDRQIVRRAPIGVDQRVFLVRQRVRHPFSFSSFSVFSSSSVFDAVPAVNRFQARVRTRARAAYARSRVGGVFDLPSRPQPVVERASVRPAFPFPDLVGAAPDAMLVGFLRAALAHRCFRLRLDAMRPPYHRICPLPPFRRRRANCAAFMTFERRPLATTP